MKMGQYHRLVNLSKKEFVEPHSIGNGMKLREQVGWEHSTSTVLVMLLAASNGRGGGDFCSNHPRIGSWAGDQIAFIGDYADTKDIARCNAQEIYENCSENKNGWKDISSEVRDMMCSEFNIEYKGEDGWLEIVEKKKV